MMKRLALTLAALAAFALSSHAAERKPIVIGSGGQQQQIQSTDTLKLPAATTANASINLPHGTAPTSPNNGDCWTTTSGLFCRINGATVGPLGSGGGTPGGSSGQIQYNNGGAFGGFTMSGDVTVNTGTGAAVIANDAVTYAKMQNVSATSRVLGRKTAGSGDPEELTLSDVLDFIGSAAQGDILYRGASGWGRLPAGTAGKVLQTNGASNDPSWENVGTGSLSGYAAGTWTPAFNFGGGTTGLTHTKQVGYYVRVGKLVTIWFDVQLSNKGSSTGSAFVSGLPYNASTSVNQVSSPMWTTNTGALNALAYFGTASGAGTAKQFGFRSDAVTLAALTNTAFNNGDEVAATLSYMTDDP